MAKRLLCVILSLLMIIAVLPTGVVADGNEAKVGDNEYSTLSEAISAASNGDTVTLLSDVTLSSALTISNDITLDLGGHTIYATSSSTKITLSGTITITNGTINGGTYFVSLTNVSYNNSMVTVSSGAVVTSNNVNFTGTYGYLNMLCVVGTMTINGGTLQCRTIYLMSGCDLTVNEGTTIDATAANETIYYNAFEMYLGSTITINGGTIKSTKNTFARQSSGTATTEVPNWKITITGGTFIVNEAGVNTSSTAEIYQEYNSILGKYTNNSSTNYVKSCGDVTITGGTYNKVLVLGDSYRNSSNTKCYDAIDTNVYTSILGEDYESSITENADGTYTIGTSEEVPELYGKSLYIGTQIGVVYYYTLDESIVEDYASYSVEFTVGSTTQDEKITLSPKVVGSTTYYVATCNVSFYQMAQNIKAQVYYTDSEGMTTAVGEASGGTYTVRQYYVNKYSTSTTTSTIKTLLESMLNFGSYGQIYIAGETEVSESELANYDLNISSAIEDVSASDLESYKAVTTNEVDSYKVYGSVLISDSDSAKLNFTFSGVSGCTVTVNGNEVTIGEDGTGTYTTDDIYVQNWDSNYTIVISDGNSETEDMTVEFSVLSYAYSILNEYEEYESDNTKTLSSGNTVNLRNLLKAMCLYNEAADAYLGTD